MMLGRFSTRSGLSREGGAKPRPRQNRNVVIKVWREIQRHVHRAATKLTAWVTIHAFGKSFVRNHADGATPIHALQQRMGHSSIDTTRRFYIRVGDANE